MATAESDGEGSATRLGVYLSRLGGQAGVIAPMRFRVLSRFGLKLENFCGSFVGGSPDQSARTRNDLRAACTLW